MNIFIRIILISVFYIIIIGFYTGFYYYFRQNFILTTTDYVNNPSQVPITMFDCFYFSCSVMSGTGYGNNTIPLITPISQISKLIISSQQIVTLIFLICAISFLVGDCTKKMKLLTVNEAKLSYMNKLKSKIKKANEKNKEGDDLLNDEAPDLNPFNPNQIKHTGYPDKYFKQYFKIVPF